MEASQALSFWRQELFVSPPEQLWGCKKKKGILKILYIPFTSIVTFSVAINKLLTLLICTFLIYKMGKIILEK